MTDPAVMAAPRHTDVLEQIAGERDVTTGVDVIFVHGAESDALSCWHPVGH